MSGYNRRNSAGFYEPQVASHHADGHPLPHQDTSHGQQSQEDADYNRMREETKSHAEMKNFLHHDKWKVVEEGPSKHQLDQYGLWKLAEDVYKANQDKDKGKGYVYLTEIMKHPWKPRARYNRFTTTDAMSEDLAPHRGNSQVAIQLRLGAKSGNLSSTEKYHGSFHLHFDVLGPGIHGQHQMIRMLITPGHYKEGQEHGPYMVILMDTRLMVFVLFRHAPSSCPRDDAMFILFPEPAVHRRTLEGDVWKLDPEYKIRNENPSGPWHKRFVDKMRKAKYGSEE